MSYMKCFRPRANLGSPVPGSIIAACATETRYGSWSVRMVSAQETCQAILRRTRVFAEGLSHVIDRLEIQETCRDASWALWAGF